MIRATGPPARRMHHEADDRYPTRVHRDDERRRAPHSPSCPRHVLGGTAVRRPERQGERGASSAPAARAGPTRARCSRKRTARSSRSPIRPKSGTCPGWYYGGKSGRGPVKAEVEKHYAAKTPNHTCAVYEDFRVMLEKEKAIDAVLIATPDHLHAFVSHPGDEGGQARVLREAAHAQRSRGPARGARREGDARSRRRWAITAARARVTARPSSGSRTARSAPCVKCTPGAARRAPPRTSGRARGRPSSPPGSTGTSGSALAPIRPVQRKAGPVRLALGMGLRQRHHARHVAASLRSRVQRARPRRARHRRSPASFVDPQVITGSNMMTYRFAREGRSRAADGCSGTTTA